MITKQEFLKAFLDKFNKNYDFLYNNDNVAGYDEAVDAFDNMNDKEKAVLLDFAKYRQDFIASDREAAAFMFTIEDFGI